MDCDEDEYEDRLLGDGIYEVSDTCVIEEHEDEYGREGDAIASFAKLFPDFCIASAYETNSTILLSERPTRYKGVHYGTGFNYGSTNLLTQCPRRLLILAQNDWLRDRYRQ